MTPGTSASARLARQSWIRMPARPLIIVPLGSTEQHGPHLPLDTDTRVAVAISERATERLRDGRPEASVLRAPAVPYGASGEHQAFPGTVSIGHEALDAVLTELVRSLSTWAARIVFVNGHGGNVTTLARVIPRLIGERHSVSWVPCVAADGDAHAGRTETSLMLRIAPESVDLTAAVPGNEAPLTDLMDDIRAGGVRAVSESGILGNPAGASAEEGERLLEGMVAAVCRAVTSGTVDGHGRLREKEPA